MSVGRSQWQPFMSLDEANVRLTAPESPFEIEDRIIRGIPRRVWRHGPKTTEALLERSRAFGDAPFLILDNQRITFRAFRLAVRSLSAALVDRGVEKGDRVAIAMRNLP